MRVVFDRRILIWLGLALLLGVYAGMAYYLSTTKIHISLTSKTLALVVVMIFLIVFLVLPVYSVVVTREIRKRRRVEQALLLAKEEAERASKFKDQFLSTMSHELRTPLNAVLGFSDLLADKRYGELNERQQRYVSHIHTGGRHLLKLISDILDLSKIEAGRMELAFEDLSVLNNFAEVVSALRPLAEKKSQTLSHSAEPMLMAHADPTRFKQILMNLVGNAIKFTPAGGMIELAAQKIDNTVHVKVRDNGPGIPEEEQKRIFDAFYRLRNSGASVEGTGLGLAITDSLVKLQGGTLALESEAGQGSCFHFRLPLAVARKTDTTVPKTVLKARNSPRILVIEDDATTIHLIKSQLTSSGYEVVTCDQSESALEMAAEIQPHAITLDLLMKSKSGWEILIQLKNDPRTTSIPVIVVTIVDHPSMGATLGADDYLIKPVDKATLLAAVERSLDRRGVSRPTAPILVVEDDARTRELLLALLTDRGFFVTSAADGAAARAQVATALPELVILDLMLPKINGFELLAELRANPRTAELPVFVLTNKELTKEERKYLETHAESSFQKHQPWQEDLVRQIQRAVGKAQTAKA